MITISTVVLEKKKIEPEFRECKGTQYGLIKTGNFGQKHKNCFIGNNM